MQTRGIITEDFCNYKLPSLFISSIKCDFKCCKEQNLDISICQNATLARTPISNIDDNYIYELYSQNNITKAVVIGGLEPFLQYDEIESLISTFREHDERCDFIIYTGYNPEEISEQIDKLKKYENIIIKYGRYIPNKQHKYDVTLGIELASDNQYAEKIS